MSPPPNWLERFFVSSFTPDDAGVATLTAIATATTGDLVVKIRGKYGSAATPNAGVLNVLLWPVLNGELWAIDVFVTAKSVDAAIRRRIKIGALVYGAGGVAVLDAAPVPDAAGTGTATATITVVGATPQVALSPVAATALSWGFEIRAQKL